MPRRRPWPADVRSGGCPRRRWRRRRPAPRSLAARGRRGCRSAWPPGAASICAPSGGCAPRPHLRSARWRSRARPSLARFARSQSLISSSSPSCRLPVLEGARARPRRRREPAARAGPPATAASTRSCTTLRSPSRNATSMGKLHAERVHRPGRAEQDARPRCPLATEQAAAPGPPGVGHLERGEHLTVSEQPGHQSPRRHTLKRISSTSPSGDLVVLALDPELAELLGLVPRPDARAARPSGSPRPG